jgi:NusA-like KH domain protein
LNKMAKTIDMQFMRYINLFERFSGISTSDCFIYNNILFFGVPKSKINKALGPKGRNIKNLSEVLRRRAKIIEIPLDEKGVNKFIKDLIEPIEVNKIEFSGDEIVISAGMQSRAMLIGRDRIREKELLEILNKLFGIKKVRICQ